MSLLGIDIGTTHCKAGLFAADGKALQITSRPTATHRAPEGWAYYDPDTLWSVVAGMIAEIVQSSTEPVQAIGIASMAETGLLVDGQTGAARSFFVPWFDTSAQAQANRIQQTSDADAGADTSAQALARVCYQKFGVWATYKCSLAKILWLRERNPALLEGAVWLSAADYIALRLTGQMGTDYSLAGRTFAFDILQKRWDAGWLDRFGLSPELFPAAAPSGRPVGMMQASLAASTGLPVGIPVAVCGHDHICAAFAMGVIQPGAVFDSMGTAEALLGALPERPLSAADFDNGLMSGCHVLPGLAYWMGGLSASGGSVEWLRSILAAQPLSYLEMEALLAQARPGPTGILHFPYLLGSGSPHTDPNARGALVGLDASHTRADLLKAALEGTAYELELIRRAGEWMAGRPIHTLIATGGGTRNPAWLQIKADVSGCRIEVPAGPEATLLGAALLAGLGSGLYSSPEEALLGPSTRPIEVYTPDPDRHHAYQQLYNTGFVPLQAPLRAYFNQLVDDYEN